MKHSNENGTRLASMPLWPQFNNHRRSWPAPLATLVLGAWLACTNPAAASILVDNAGDRPVPGKTSLREALQRAGTLNDVIVFAQEINKIMLSRELGIARGVTIMGPDSFLLKVQAPSGSRVFNITATGDAVISGLDLESS